jgi:hypothetical protein
MAYYFDPYAAPSNESQHLKADGTPDERFSENKDQEAQLQQQQSTSPISVSGKKIKKIWLLNGSDNLITYFSVLAANEQQQQSQPQHLKEDGTPDMRFSDNRDAAVVSPVNVNLQEATSSSEQGLSVNCFAQMFSLPNTLYLCYSWHFHNKRPIRTLEKRWYTRYALQGQSRSISVWWSTNLCWWRWVFLSSFFWAMLQECPPFKLKGMSAEVGTSSSGAGGEEHLKGDGTLDMRYNSSRETVAEMEGGGDTSGMSEG